LAQRRPRSILASMAAQERKRKDTGPGLKKARGRRDRRSGADRRQFPPRPEGRRLQGRRRGDRELAEWVRISAGRERGRDV